MVDAFTQLFTTTAIYYLIFGSFLGLMVGVLPALGGAAGMALLIPFIYGMEPASAIAMIIGMLATVGTGDMVASVLLGIPGSASSQATVLDGFPMAKRGEGARALSAGFLASLMGGLFGAVILTVTLLGARQVILYFGIPEILMLVIFGVASVVSLSGRSMAKGLAICAFGMVLASVGFAPATGEQRLDFGSFYLGDGLPLIACVMGFFVVPEIIDLMRQNRAISDRPPVGSGMRQGLLDVLANKWTVIRSSSVGCLVGAMPGVGGAVVDWIVYGQTVRAAKDKSQFGKGDVRGVIGVESSNNAVLGGALVPTLLFGIPGSGSTALMLSALVMLGIQPGPAMLSSNLSLTYTMIWCLALGNVIGAGMCFAFSKQMARIVDIPFNWLVPFLIAAITFATLQVSRDPQDLILVIIFGAIGVFMRRFGFSRPAFLIGFVLQSNLERSLYQATQLYDFASFFSRPIVLVLVAIVALIINGSLRVQLSTKAEFENSQQEARVKKTRNVQILMPVGLAIFFACALFMLRDLQPLGKMFPVIACIFGLVAALIAALQIAANAPSALEDQETEDNGYQISLLQAALWLVLSIALIIAFGFFAGSAAFMAVFLAVMARARPIAIVLGTAGVVGAFLFLTYQTGTFLPDGWVLALNPWNYF